MAAKSVGKEMYKGTVWSLIDNFVRQAITFIIFIFLARLLNPNIFGMLTVAMLIVQVFKSVVFDSVATAVLRKAEPSDIDYNTAFWFCQILSLPAFLILFFFADYLENFIGTEGLGVVIQATSVIILTSGVTRIHEVWLTHRMDFKTLAIRSSISVTLGGIAGVVLAMKGYGIMSLVVQQLSASLIELILLWSITPWRPKAQFSQKSLSEIFHFGKHVALTGITNFANQNSDTFFVTYYLGSAATGIYSTGKRITSTLNTVISSSLLRVSLPAFSKLQNDDEQLRSTYLNSTALTAMITAPIFAGVSVLSRDITLIMLGEKWLESVPIMQIVTIIGFLTSIGYYNQSIMLVKNKPQWQTRLTLLYAISNVTAFMIFTRFGLFYTALAFSLRALLLYPVSAWCALTLINLKSTTYIKSLLPSLFAASIMGVVMISLSTQIQHLPIIARLILLTVAGALSYAAVLYFIIPTHYKEYAINFWLKMRNKKSNGPI